MLTEAEHRANEAQRLIEEITPYLDWIEKHSIEDALSADWEHPEGERACKRDLERVAVIRDLKTKIKSTIARGIPNKRTGTFA